ncbi:homocysteine S-methyltransferase family protein [Candidatus Babeliales bacterium]|nr:homocysteine S-methyltransferase family protein [Candidatus Babeliales bacterium]
MNVLFGPYGSVFPALGLSADVLKVARHGQQDWYRLAVEMIARGYVNAGATMPTVNAFFLRPVLHAGFAELFKDMLLLNIRALLSALANKEHQRIAICLGPVNDCYTPQVAPDTKQAYLFHHQQYELCLEVLSRLGLGRDDVVFLHETIGTEREALGLAQAAQELEIPLLVSFVVRPDGYLLGGEKLETVITNLDDQVAGFVEGFALNCCSLHAFERAMATFTNKERVKRIVGFYPNSYDADPTTYESEVALFEPHKRDSLKVIADIASAYNLNFVGGCCGFGYPDVKLLVEFVASKN